MRTSTEYLSLQLAYDPARRDALVSPEQLTTARFESVFREMNGFGTLDLVFELGDEIFVAHAIGIDVTVLAAREGPAVLWPATLHLEPRVADALEEMVTPWLMSLTRGRALGGEYVRSYRSSDAFATARERGFRGAVATAQTLTTMAPFVYARRFARDRDVFIGCTQPEFAAAVVGTVARGILHGGNCDDFALRWYGRPRTRHDPGAPTVAIVDNLDDARPATVEYIVSTRPNATARTVVVPIPVPQDHLFTFDPADAPEAARFSVLAADFAERPVRVTNIPAPVGGSDGRIALVLRDDGLMARDADTEAVEELARRLSGEGLDPFITTAGDPRIRDAHIVHVFGGVGDAHICAVTDVARSCGLPIVMTIEPLAPYAKYYEDAVIAALRIAVDEAEKRLLLDMFHESRIRIDEVPHELAATVAADRERAFEDACRGALGIVLAPCDSAASFRQRFPNIDCEHVIDAPVLIGGEPLESEIAGLIPAEPFLLLHGPLTLRSAFANLLTALGETTLAVVVAGPASAVDIAFTCRRIAGSNVVFLPDPTPADEAALYRRARAIVFSALRPTGAGRLIRAVLCGALPLVPSISPLARLLPQQFHFDAMSTTGIFGACTAGLRAERDADVRQAQAVVAPFNDQRTAFRTIIDLYARAAMVAAP